WVGIDIKPTFHLFDLFPKSRGGGSLSSWAVGGDVNGIVDGTKPVVPNHGGWCPIAIINIHCNGIYHSEIDHLVHHWVGGIHPFLTIKLQNDQMSLVFFQ